MSTVSPDMLKDGWTFNQDEGSSGDAVNGKSKLSEIYLLADPKYSGRVSVPVLWDKKRAAIECMEGQEHLWEYYTRVAENRANHFMRNSGGQGGGRKAKYAEGFQSVFPRTVDEF